jgi:alpha-1,3-mannosylglycoprotein beta-1,4-N-acetylglucosaminyltransferase C
MKKLVIGLCTVSTRKINYLPDTVRGLLNNMTEYNKPDILIRVYNCDFKGIEVNPVEGFEREVDKGVIELVRVDSHPEFGHLPNNFDDDNERVKWRTKQCYDYSEAFRLSYGLGEYYMHIEDDVIAGKDFDAYVFREIAQGGNWCSIHMTQGGFIGWVFRNNDLPRLSALFREFRDEMPPDWLIEFFVDIKVHTGKRHIQTDYSIFQHIGSERTLINSIQTVVFDNFIGT